ADTTAADGGWDTPEGRHILEVQRAWVTAIADDIAGHWHRVEPFAKGLRCKVQIDLDTKGNVLAAEIVQRSGNDVFDESIILAIGKANPLPLPKDPHAFVSQLLPVFTPEALER